MKHLKRFNQFRINEGQGLQNIGVITKVFSRALTDKFSLSILPDILKMTKGNLQDTNSWIESYKNIFRKACKKFGGGKEPDINASCNKDQTIKNLYDHMLGDKGIMDKDSIDKYFQNLFKGVGPDENLQFDPPIEEIDAVTMAMIDALSETGVSNSTIKEVGEKVIRTAFPYMKKCYPNADFEKLKMFSSGKLIDPKELEKMSTDDGEKES
jgi:hypothetical protein